LLNFISAGLMTLVGLSAAAESKEYLKGDRPQQRGYSEAVITEGGRTAWLGRATLTAKCASFSRTCIARCKKAGGTYGDVPPTDHQP
jgi:hypothetical protein